MKTKVLFATLFATGLLFASCSKDEDPAPITKEEAIVEINSLKATYDAEENGINNNDGNVAFSTINQLGLPFDLPATDVDASASRSSFFESRMKKVSEGDLRAAQHAIGIFAFDQHVGTWTYNKSTLGWDHDSLPAGKVVIKFPYPSTNANNNAVYTISKYTIAVTDAGIAGEYAANIVINSVDVWNVSLKLASTSASVTSTYKLVCNTLTTPKVTYEFNEGFQLVGAKTGSTVKVTSSIVKNATVLVSADFTVTVSSSGDTSNIAMIGNIRLANIRFEYKLNFSSGISGASFTDYEVNVYNANDAKLGYIKISVDANNNATGVFYYADGTTANANELFGDVFTTLSDMFSEIKF